MRVYSNTHLIWPQLIHITQAARLYPGQWFNYHFFKVNDINPLKLISYSPISLLQENRQYYCYDKFYNKYLHKIQNSYDMATVINQKPADNVTSIYFPNCVSPCDIIVIYDNNINNKIPIIHSSYFILC